MQPTNPPASSKPPAAKLPETPKTEAGKPNPKTPPSKPVSAAPAPDPKARKDAPPPSHVDENARHAAAQQAVAEKHEAMSGLPRVSPSGTQKLDTQTMSDQPSAKHTKS